MSPRSLARESSAMAPQDGVLDALLLGVAVLVLGVATRPAARDGSAPRPGSVRPDTSMIGRTVEVRAETRSGRSSPT